MFCSQCGFRIQDGAHFCENCGAPLRAPGGVRQQPVLSAPELIPSGTRRAGKLQDPYKEQIAELKLQIRQLKLHLKQITTNMSNIRSQYNETAAFVPRGLLRWGDKAIEDFRLLGPQQQKQQLQQQIMQLEQQLLGLQQAQAQWKAQQQR
jgi:predicted amidophosphoribosyltransferase